MAAEVVGEGPEDGPGDGAQESSGTPLGLRNRPWHVFAGRLLERLGELAEAPVWAMDGEETAESIVELVRAQAVLAGGIARLLAHAERVDLAAVDSATSTAGWLRGRVPVTPRTARQAVALGRALETDTYPATAAGLACGRVLPDQAEVIIAAVDALPDRLFAEDRLAAEAHLVDLARVYDAQVLARLGRHLLEVIDPELAEAELAARLEAEEAAAARATSLTLRDDGHGKAHGRFTLPSLHGQMLRRILEGFANPQAPDPIPRTEPHPTSHPDPGDPDPGTPTGDPDPGDEEGVAAPGPGPRGPVRRRPSAAVLGDALVRMVETYPRDRVPTSGGMNATVVVTVPVQTLTDTAQTPATLPGTGQDVSAATARRLACAAGTIPAVLGGPSRVLDLGRRSRLATGAQRLALYLQQHGRCALEHCDRPASWADAHHWQQSWADGGRTDLSNLILICPRHHTLAHRAGASITSTTDHTGQPTYRIHHQT